MCLRENTTSHNSRHYKRCRLQTVGGDAGIVEPFIEQAIRVVHQAQCGMQGAAWRQPPVRPSRIRPWNGWCAWPKALELRPCTRLGFNSAVPRASPVRPSRPHSGDGIVVGRRYFYFPKTEYNCVLTERHLVSLLFLQSPNLTRNQCRESAPIPFYYQSGYTYQRAATMDFQ